MGSFILRSVLLGIVALEMARTAGLYIMMLLLCTESTSAVLTASEENVKNVQIALSIYI